MNVAVQDSMPVKKPKKQKKILADSQSYHFTKRDIAMLKMRKRPKFILFWATLLTRVVKLDHDTFQVVGCGRQSLHFLLYWTFAASSSRENFGAYSHLDMYLF